MPSLTTLVDGTVPVAADFMFNFQALNNAIGSLTAISAWAIGEIPYASAANTLNRLTPGSFGQVLTMGASVPAWANAGQAVDQITGLTLSNDSGSPNTTLDIAVGAAASDDSTLANRVLMSLTSAFTKNMNSTWAVGTGNGGLATGVALGVGTWYHVFLIERPDTAVVDIAADTSATGANISSLASGAYTKKRRIGSFATDASSHIIPFTQVSDLFMFSTPFNATSAVNPGTSAVTVTVSVPLGIVVEALLDVTLVAGTSGNTVLYLSPIAVTDQAPAAITTPIGQLIGPGAAGATSMAAGQLRVLADASQHIRYRLSASGAADRVTIDTAGYYDRRGRG